MKISFHTIVNAVSIPLIAAILSLVLYRVLDPTAWCSAQSELAKNSVVEAQQALRCTPLLMAQLKTGFWVSIGLTAALTIAHLVSVVSDVKATLSLNTKLGSMAVGQQAVDRAVDQVVETTVAKGEEVKGAS